MIKALDADLFKACFTARVEVLRDGAPDIIAVDGKTARRCHARGQGHAPLHTVSAWASRQRLVLGQEATDAKSNEITAIPRLLERLELTGALVTDAKPFATAVRAHWHIENRLHWVLDVVFHEDLARLRTGNGPQNMAVVRHMAMNLVRAPADRHSLKAWRKLANLSPDYLEKLVRHSPPST